MNIDDLNEKFIEEAAKREEIARQKCGHRPGRFQAMARQQGALHAAIKLISTKEPSEGLKKLYLCQGEIPDAHKLSIEQLYIEFAEQYRSQFPDLFPDDVIQRARAKLPNK